MAFRVNDRGSFHIKRSYKGIGQIRRASGTKDEKTFDEILDMLTKLLDSGKHDILREIRDGVLSPIEVYGYWTNGDLQHVPSGLTLKKVIPTIPDWIDTHDVVPTTKRN